MRIPNIESGRVILGLTQELEMEVALELARRCSPPSEVLRRGTYCESEDSECVVRTTGQDPEVRKEETRHNKPLSRRVIAPR